MLIQSAGYMWHRKHIDWSKRHLFGIPEVGKGPQSDFADQSGIYGLYSADHQCIYIGQAGKGDTSSLFDRLKDHATEDHLFCFWERFTWFGFYSAEQLRDKKYPDPISESVWVEEALNTLESVAIYLALPRFNKQFERGFSAVSWYYQADEFE